ncbi:MAG: FAD-dependent oxidoreductase [Acidobacteria bacterium]|nr:FAD-dependent oxidoreductase [Acidobacteriota bacterium]
MYDLAVIGGGPAGCAAAIMAARSLRRVLLLERGRFPRHKVCGEFISGEATGLLEQLLAPPYRYLIEDAPRICRARIFAGHSTVDVEIEPSAISIPRIDLDRALWHSAIQAGVDAREHLAVEAINVERPRSASRAATTYSVTIAGQSFPARALLHAGGRWSFLTSHVVRVHARKKRWIGLKAHFLEPRPSASVDLYFFPGGYCGVQPVSSTKQEDGGTLVNVCAMVDAQVARSLTEIFDCHAQLSSRSRNWQPAGSPVSTAPLLFHPPEPVRGCLLQAGDAATFVDPFIGDGISLALRSGSLAADCLQAFFAGHATLAQAAENYRTRYHQTLSPIFRASSRLRTMLNWPDLVLSPAMFLLAKSPGLTRRLVAMTR